MADRLFSLCKRRDSCFSLWWWRKWWRAVWRFESGLFQRRFFEGGRLSPGCGRRPGPRVHSCWGTGGWWWGRLDFERSWRFGFRELNGYLIGGWVTLSQVETSFCCRMRRKKTKELNERHLTVTRWRKKRTSVNKEDDTISIKTVYDLCLARLVRQKHLQKESYLALTNDNV